MAEWIESLLEDERYELIKEMHEMGKEHPEYEIQLGEVRLCEKWLEYVRGSMKDARWR